jgi:hypothetical protein
MLDLVFKIDVGLEQVDCRFELLLEDRLGPEDWERLSGGDDTLGVNDPFKAKHLFGLMHDRFEPIKHGFSNDPDLVQGIPLPHGIGDVDNAEKGIMDGCIRLTKYVSVTIQAFFHQ